jgi:hypothetical protein
MVGADLRRINLIVVIYSNVVHEAYIDVWIDMRTLSIRVKLHVVIEVVVNDVEAIELRGTFESKHAGHTEERNN